MNFETNLQLKSVKDKKLYIFDLDETLWNGRALYPGVLEILRSLVLKGHLIYIASFNMDVPGALKYLGITHLFHGGAYGRDRSKYDMIKEIFYYVISKYKYVPIKVEFYDDQMSNVIDVHKKSNGWVRAVYIEQPHGLKQSHLDPDAPLRFVYGKRIYQVSAR